MLYLRRLLSRRQPKVFGFGFSKTGTTTLGACLRELGYRHSGYSPDLLDDWGNRNFAPIWRNIKRYDSFEDWPYPLMFSEIMERYGDGAFYILTVRRDTETWLESLKKHSLRQSPGATRFRRIAYGVNYPHEDEQAMRAKYERHNLSVEEKAISLGLQGRLRVLCWERGDGWNELCDFLGKPRITAPFPHRNRAPLEP